MKIGILGGSFDPPHLGHLRLAEQFIASAGLDFLLIIPAARPPHKQALTASDFDRLAMCRLCFSSLKNADICEIELGREGKSYSIDTLIELNKKYPKDELCLAVGTDMLLYFDKWHRYREIFDYADVYALERESSTADEMHSFIKRVLPEFSSYIHIIKTEPLEISSTELRQRLQGKQSCDGFLATEVYDYIKARGLYGV